MSDRTYDKLRAIAQDEWNAEHDSIQVMRRQLAAELGIYVEEYDCCIQNCMIFIGPNLLRRKCVHCNTARFYEDDEDECPFYSDIQEYAAFSPRAVYRYLPIIPRLKLLYANPTYSAKMRYPKALLDDPWEEGIRDVWEGDAMKHLREQGGYTCI